MKTLIAILMLVLTCIMLIVMISDSEQAQRFYRMVEVYINGNKAQSKSKLAITRERPEIKKQDKKIQLGSRSTTSSRRDASEITPEKLRIAIKGMTHDSDKVEHIRNYKDSVTDNIKLPMITSILNEFIHDSSALEALDLLKHKISKNYSDEDLEAFVKVFTHGGSITKAMSILKK